MHKKIFENTYLKLLISEMSENSRSGYNNIINFHNSTKQSKYLYYSVFFLFVKWSGHPLRLIILHILIPNHNVW